MAGGHWIAATRLDYPKRPYDFPYGHGQLVLPNRRTSFATRRGDFNHPTGGHPKKYTTMSGSCAAP